jgi:O-antigen/teichoic acid export membrane protein
MAPLSSKVIRGAVWSAAETWGRQATIFAIFIVLARHLGPNALGLAALAMMVPTILCVFMVNGIPDALIQRPEIQPMHLDSTFWLLVGVGAALSALTWAFAGTIGIAFSQPDLQDLVRWASIIILLQAVAAVPTAILKRRLNFRLFALRTLAGTAVGGTVGISMAVSGFGAGSLVAMQVARGIVETVVLLAGSAWRPRLRYSRAHCQELFGFAGPIIGQCLWSRVNDELPKVVLGAFLGPNAVGIYTLARRPLDLLAEVFLSPLISVVMPTISRVQGEPTKIDRFFNTAVRMAVIAGFPAFIGFAAIAPEAVPFIFGDQWAGGVLAVQILMPLGLQRTIEGICAFTILALGHPGLILKFSLAYMILGVVVLPAAAHISVEATMVGLVVCNLVLMPVFLLSVQRIARIDVMQPLAITPRVLAAGLLMFFAVTVWRFIAPERVPQLIFLACAIGIGALVYAAAAFMLVRSDLSRAFVMLQELRDRRARERDGE